MGEGRFGLVGVESPDPVLSMLAALGLAVSAGTAIVLDQTHPAEVDVDRVLAVPVRPGVAVVRLGGEQGAALPSLTARWPAVVVRNPAPDWTGPLIPVRPLIGGLLTEEWSGPAVWQPVWGGIRRHGPGPVLPRLPSGTARALLSGRVPARSRWVQAWKGVWGMPWT